MLCSAMYASPPEQSSANRSGLAQSSERPACSRWPGLASSPKASSRVALGLWCGILWTVRTTVLNLARDLNASVVCVCAWMWDGLMGKTIEPSHSEAAKKRADAGPRTQECRGISMLRSWIGF